MTDSTVPSALGDASLRERIKAKKVEETKLILRVLLQSGNQTHLHITLDVLTYINEAILNQINPDNAHKAISFRDIFNNLDSPPTPTGSPPQHWLAPLLLRRSQNSHSNKTKETRINDEGVENLRSALKAITKDALRQGAVNPRLIEATVDCIIKQAPLLPSSTSQKTSEATKTQSLESAKQQVQEDIKAFADQCIQIATHLKAENPEIEKIYDMQHPRGR